MAELHFNNDHNKVAYLLKPTESQGFHQIIEFMNGLYIMYALTANPTINASVGRQFWGSASEVSLPDGVKGLVALKARIKKLEKKCKPSISHHIAWLKSVQRLSKKKRFRKKEPVSKQERKMDKKDKPEPTLDNSTFDADLGMDYMDTEEPVNEGRPSEEIEELVSTTRLEESTVRPDVATVDPIAPPTTTTNIEDSSRPARSILILKPLPTINPKDKGKGVLKEPEPTKKMPKSDLDAAQIAKDAEVARLVYEEELVKLEREKEKRHKEEEASKAAIAKMYDEVQARIEADELFAAKMQ
nr:hypothetical protein [Tanacetum cinerariifolium]